MDPILQAASTLGVGGFVAYLALTWKREDDKIHRTELATIIEQQTALNKSMLEALIANTHAMQALNTTVNNIASLEHLKDRLDRIEGAVGVKNETTK